MADAMIFPDTFEEFVKIFGFVDSKEYYTNGSELIQVFRVEQWLEHEFNRLEKENANYSRNNRSLTAAVTEMQKALKKQSAEIERLQNECFCIANERDAIADCLDTAVAEAKAEAIKECLDWVLSLFPEDKNFTTISRFTIKQKLKEMVGDSNV